ncbi:MAG: DUF6622 family protein [Burkholderiaceae bacterium]
MTSYVPTWVFVLLAVLVAIGYQQSRPRRVAPATVLAIAVAMAVYSGWSIVANFGLAPLAVTGWLAGFGLAAAIGARWFSQRGLSYDATSGRVHMPGSWLPMVLILGIFATRATLGTAAAIGMPITAASPLAAPLAGALGLLSGGFAARAIAVLAAARGSATRHEPQQMRAMV